MGTESKDSEDDLNVRGEISSLRQEGARPLRALNVRRILNVMRCSTGSQWRSQRTGVTEENLRVRETSLAAVFCTFCRWNSEDLGLILGII